MRLLKGALFAALGVAVVGAVVGWFVYQRVHAPFRAFTSAEQFVDIPPGTAAAAIGASLAEAGVVRDAETFRVALWWSGRARS